MSIFYYLDDWYTAVNGQTIHRVHVITPGVMITCLKKYTLQDGHQYGARAYSCWRYDSHESARLEHSSHRGWQNKICGKLYCKHLESTLADNSSHDSEWVASPGNSHSPVVFLVTTLDWDSEASLRAQLYFLTVWSQASRLSRLSWKRGAISHSAGHLGDWSLYV